MEPGDDSFEAEAEAEATHQALTKLAERLHAMGLDPSVTVADLGAILPTPGGCRPAGSDEFAMRCDDDVDRFTFGHPDQVLIDIFLFPMRLIVAEPEITWEVQTPKLGEGSIHLDISELSSLEQLQEAAESAAQMRRATFLTCTYCKETVGPEHRYSDDPPTCHGCATTQFGVVY